MRDQPLDTGAYSAANARRETANRTENIPHDRSAPIIALERNGEQRDCATKVCSGAGFTQLPQMLADHDVLIIGNGQKSPSS
jgi:hypothetical protein